MTTHRFAIALLAGLCLALPACGDPAPGHDESASHDEHGHAPAGAVPGSHEDWCVEHEVPESRCTLCDPALAAAFKATGDWCPEHGLPESQCVACDPSRRMERPAPGDGK